MDAKLTDLHTAEPEGMCEFIRELSDERLDWLIVDPILGSDVLKHAATCESCGARVEEQVERDFANLTSQQRHACETPAYDPLYRELAEIMM